MKSLKLNDQTDIPILGFGTWQLGGKTCQDAVETALKVGYRHIDTADIYGNHKQVGQAMKNSGLKREEIFLTTKVWRTSLHHDEVIESANRFLKELQTDYIDLLLIHWPNRDVPIEETLKAMAQLKEKGIIKAAGVSNFTIHHLKDALKTGQEITNNQVEFHPSLNQEDLRKFCHDHNIQITAYSPIAQGQDLKLPVIQEMAKKYQVSPSQIVLNWLIQKDIVAIPRSTKPEHIEDNFKSLELELSQEDIQKIDGLNHNNRLGHPVFSDFDY